MSEVTGQKVAIVGGGPAGMALALALHRHGVACTIFEARPREQVRQDVRVLALSQGAMQILGWLGVRETLLASHSATAIEHIHISHRHGLGRTRLTAHEQNVAALGYVVAASTLIAALDERIAAVGIEYHENSKVSAGETALRLADHALIAWAEGAVDPRLAHRRSYEQHAILATVQVAGGHRHIAWERFTDTGPIALLPLGADYALVQACPTALKEGLLALDETAFIAQLQVRFGQRLRMTGVSARSSYPLGLQWREHTVAERQVWLGNAAQTLHPVAGQGFNLALRDVWELAQTLGESGDIAHPAALRRYAARRALDRHGVIGFTHNLIDIFGSGFAPIRHARGAGLVALDLLPPLRRFVARRMMFGARGG
jgi:2-octaprenyl-6-methoxyphenol hydroxylase